MRQSTENIAQHLDRLKHREIITSDFARLHKTVADELRSQVNLTVALVLAKTEITDAHAYQEERLEIEERLKSS